MSRSCSFCAFRMILRVRDKQKKKGKEEKIKSKKTMALILLLVVAFNINNITVGSKRIVINSKTYQEGNTNLVLNKILSDNELKQEIPHMFNYASNGNYTNYDMETLNDLNYITEGLYSNVDEDGTTYYFRGDTNNNNIQFGEYEKDYYIYEFIDKGYISYYQDLERCKEAEGTESC